ncbi:hypothetical protein [Bradyrhizobium tropiciagri]|uniref:hypothetical protein n=1 Tax=Bradyrhizobium tropiciagri TaxID=312253 RepID=UPI0012FEBC0E|nr:hypothetical protein [Bradyrhizobium tropiciagri]
MSVVSLPRVLPDRVTVPTRQEAAKLSDWLSGMPGKRKAAASDADEMLSIEKVDHFIG